MSAFAETARLNWHRYLNSKGIWLLMLVAPIGARFWVPRTDGMTMAVAVDGALPVMTPAVVGLSLGVVVATSFLPIAWAYLRRNVTNVRAWQTEDVTVASRLKTTLGRFAADIAVLAIMLAALTVAGSLLAEQTGQGAMVGSVAMAVWLIGFPPLVFVAGLRALLDSRNLTRGAGGDVVFALLWLATLSMPLAVGTGSGLLGAVGDFAGFVRPLSSGDLSRRHALAVGVFPVTERRVPVDVPAGLRSDGYVVSRLIWCGIGIALALGAALIYRSPTPIGHRAPRRVKATIVPRAARRARRAAYAWFGNIGDEAAGLLRNPRTILLLVVLAAAGVVLDYRRWASPAILLWLVFAASREAGRWQVPSLQKLTLAVNAGPLARWSAFVAAGTLLSVLLSVPAAVGHLSPSALFLGLLTGAIASSVAAALAILTRSALVPRLVLMVAWYGYFVS